MDRPTAPHDISATEIRPPHVATDWPIFPSPSRRDAWNKRNSSATEVQSLALAHKHTAMFKVRVIPCLDVKDGRVVKGVKFVNLRDAGDPVEAAIAYDAAGADELTFLDITASHEKRDTIFEIGRAHV